MLCVQQNSAARGQGADCLLAVWCCQLLLLLHHCTHRLKCDTDVVAESAEEQADNVMEGTAALTGEAAGSSTLEVVVKQEEEDQQPGGMIAAVLWPQDVAVTVCDAVLYSFSERYHVSMLCPCAVWQCSRLLLLCTIHQEKACVLLSEP